MLPLVGRELPIIADEYVKTDFGTGCLKITPGHDPNDFEIGRQHGLPELSAIGEDGRMTDLVPEYAGLTVEEAQAEVVADLEAAGAIAGQGALPAHGAVQPPLRPAHRAADLAAVVHEDGRAGRAGDPGGAATAASRSTPSRSRAATSTGWRTSGRGASRASCGGATRSRSGTAATRPTSATTAPEGDGWERDPDVLDTWFSSALWPFATLGWPERDARAAGLLPDRRPLDGARHPVPVGRAHGDDGAGVHGRHPVRATSTCTRSSRRPTAGGCRSRWARASTRWS